MNACNSLIVASIVLSSTWAPAAEADRPRPDLWDRYPQIRREVDLGMARLDDTLAAFGPKAFSAKHPALARMAKSKDWPQRVRALKAIAALENPSGIPLLVEGIMDARNEKALNEAMTPLTMWIATRSPRDKFKPLAPLFLHILVNSPDWPSVRCRCLQALGNLADREWLPIIKELLVSRHPAVTNMSTWVIQQVSSRSRNRGGAGTGRPSKEELAAIIAKIKRLIQTLPENRKDDRIFYSQAIGWHDGWIPMSPSMQETPPNSNVVLIWRYRAGRLHSITTTEPCKPSYVSERVWYNSKGAPILEMRNSTSNQPYYFRWGDYDRDGLLRRVVSLQKDYFLERFSVHDNGPKYSQTVIRDFDARGELISITRYADKKVIYTDLRNGAASKLVNHGHRVDFICKLEDFGLAPFYPIPSGPMKAEPNDPPGSMVRIASVQVQPVCVEQQCRAKVVVRNHPADRKAPPTVICDHIMIRIYDTEGRLIFRAGHGWGGLELGKPLCLNTDTHSNTLRAAGGKPFLLPKPGRYTLSITACKGDSGKWTDSKSVTFHVGMDRSEFKVLSSP